MGKNIFQFIRFLAPSSCSNKQNRRAKVCQILSFFPLEQIFDHFTPAAKALYKQIARTVQSDTAMIRSSNLVNTERGRELPINAYLQCLFDKHDLDRDNHLSIFEFQEILKMLTRITGATFPKRQDIDDIFNYLDRDGDQTISRRQYEILLKDVQTLFSDMGIKLLYRGKKHSK